jgi:hypothetical protein
MNLSENQQRVWDFLKAEGRSDDEIISQALDLLYDYHSDGGAFETEEEKAEREECFRQMLEMVPRHVGGKP